MESEVRPVVEDLEELVRQGDADAALAELAALHPADQAELLVDLDPEQRRVIIERMDPRSVGAVLTHLDEEDRAVIVHDVPRDKLGRALDSVDDDVAVDILHALKAEDAARVLATMTKAVDIAPLLAHPDESAGGRMTRGFIALRADMTVDEAINYLRLVKPNTEEAFYLYVVDAMDRLEGVVSLRQLVVAPPRTPVSEVMSRDVVAVRAGTDQEECARLIRRYNLLALPVVDESDRLLGVTTIDDLMDVAEEEATEDMYRMVGMAETESFYRPVPSSIRRRLPWLFVNLGTALLAATVVSLFEGTISRFAVLAVFMPVVAGIGGNAGIQTLTLTVRGLALGEVSVADALWVVARELGVAAANGLAIGMAVGITAFVWERNVYLSLVLGAAMVLNMLAAALAGVLVPLGLKVVGADPALASGVFVTTVTDVMGFLFFLGLATMFISYLA